MPLGPTDYLQKVIAPIREILAGLIQSGIGNAATDPTARETIISIADMALTSEYPLARLIPAALRRQLIRQVLDSLLSPPRSAAAGGSGGTTNSEMAAADLPEAQAAQIEAAAPGDSVRGFIVDGKNAELGPVRASVADTLGSESEVTRIDGTASSFQVTTPGRVLSVSQAWELAHQLTNSSNIVAADPVIEWVPAPPEIGGPPQNLAAAMAIATGQLQTLSCAAAPTWSTDAVNAEAAWKISEQSGRPSRGKGIKVAHLDTGVTYHTDLPPFNNGSVILNADANLYDPGRTGGLPMDPMDVGPIDILKTWFIPMNGHGTGTLSVLLAPAGRPITGVAPLATAMPVRIGPTVVHWNLQHIINGINYARTHGCQVITMSMGGPPPATRALANVVDAAIKEGIIFCSAAGNIIGSSDLAPIVVWPAAMDKVIAVGGGNCRGQAWSGSSRGPEVNISAEAQDVWHAAAIKGSTSQTPGTDIAPGNGTSFATPAVAGLAACWLAHRGVPELTAHYGDASYIPLAFAKLLSTVAFTTPAGWNANLMGPGVVDGKKLLEAPLPPIAALSNWPVKSHSLASNALGFLFKHFFPFAGVAAGSSQAFNANAMADRFRGEILYHLFDRPALYAAVAHAAANNKLGAAPGQAAAAPPEIIASLKAIASPSLKEALGD